MGSLHVYMCVCVCVCVCEREREREIKIKGNSTKPKGACPNTLNYVWFLEALIMKCHEIHISTILFAS